MHAVGELFQLVGLGLVLLLPLMNPLTTVALLLALSGRMTTKERNRQSLLASIYVFAITMIAFYAGQFVMNTFGISIPGLRIAGGMIVAYIGFRMLFPPHNAGEVLEAKEKQGETSNIAFVPLAMPSTAGPGTIAMIISTAASVQKDINYSNWVHLAAPTATFLTLALILWACLRGANTLMRIMGKDGIDALSRVMGFLLVCMGVQFFINGILEIAQSL